MSLIAKTFAEYCLQPIATAGWLMEGLIPADGWVMLQAAPKTGKSMFAAQMVDSMAQQLPFLAWKPERQIRCLYIQVDAPPGDWQAQVQQLHLTTASTLDRQDLPLKFLDKPAHRGNLRALIDGEGFEYVVWDAAEKLTGQDLNKKDGCQYLLEHLAEVWAGPSLVIHHPRKLSDAGNWKNVDEAAGHHYLTADASAILTMRMKILSVLGRRAESLWEMVRDPETHAWVQATAVPLV